VVAAVRILAWGFMGFASAVIGGLSGEPRETSVPRQLAIFGWFMFAVAVLLLLRRVRFTTGRALVWPIVFMAVDFAVLVYVNLDTTRGVHPAVGCSVLAIVLAFSVARFSTLHVWVATAMATTGVVIQALWLHWWNARAVAIVTASYLGLATMVHWANRQIRRMFVDVRRRDRLTRFLPGPVAARILDEGSRALLPAKREVTILFSDIRDFTTLSERMDPAGVLHLLDDYFTRMTAIVRAQGGMVNKFIGDGLMAVWGAPDAHPDHALRAVQAALQMRAEMVELNALRTRDGLEPLRIGIGIHTGTVAAGMLGGPEQTEYTVLGDPVNVASRVEGLTKALQTDILVTEANARSLPPSVQVQRMGAESVKGRGEQVVVYRLPLQET
jgi:adenylate cyclase